MLGKQHPHSLCVGLQLQLQPIEQVSFRADLFVGHIFDFLDVKSSCLWINYKQLTCLTFLGPRTCHKLTFYGPGDPRGADRDPKGPEGRPERHFNTRMEH